MRLIWTVTLGLLAGMAAASAQDGRASGQEGFGRGRFSAFSVGFAALDANGDGVLDAQELEAAPQALAKLDKNSDGRITADEVRPPMPEGRGRGGAEGGPGGNLVGEMVKTLMAFDADADGKLSRSELPERFQGIFDRGDENHDGFLTVEEIRKIAAPAGGGPGAPGGRDADGGRGGEGGRGRGEMNFIRMDPVLAAVDSNGDGVISAEEIRNSPAALRKLDQDGDGKVSREEAMPPRGRGRRF